MVSIETSVLKIDFDVKLREDDLGLFVLSRLKLLEWLDILVVSHHIKETEHGFHMWFEVYPKLEDGEIALIQCLIGDDQKRCKFNFLRNEANVFHEFNALFSKKLPKRKKGGEIIGEKV
jgi:hypothetical protein